MAEGGLIQLEHNSEERRDSTEYGLPPPVEPVDGSRDKAGGGLVPSNVPDEINGGTAEGLPPPVDPDHGKRDKAEGGLPPQDITDEAIVIMAEPVERSERIRIRTEEGLPIFSKTSEIKAGDRSSGVAERVKAPHIQRDYTFKVIVIGDPGTGKTSLARRFCDNKYEENYKMTIGVDFFAKNIIKDGAKVNLRIFDIGSQEHTRVLTRAFYKQASGAIVCYDITNQVLLNAAASWKSNAEQLVRLPDGYEVPCLLVGTKVDLLKEAIPDNDRIMADFVDTHKFISWVETSAKDNIGVEDAFKRLIDEMIRSYNEFEDNSGRPRDTIHRLREDARPRRWNERCSC